MWRSDRGFTLLEVLLALGLLAILSTALYGTWFSVMRGKESATARMEADRELRATLDQLRRELSAAVYDKAKANPRLHFVVEDRDFFGKPASILNFTTIIPPKEGAEQVSDQAEVRYRPIERDGKITLARQVKDLYHEEDPLLYPQMEELEGFLVECSPDGSKWVRVWDTAQNSNLPKAIRVTITIKEGEGTVNFSTIASPRRFQ
ncbi:type II secretion system protein GspJ [Geobacter sp. DSM 9736]|uniref:type II secretion system protein GspJ n=1 Tax=Geobacter sp. DSM 9736 TaxID=1277350 RepID=UPI000B50BEDE|nr:type II secretion system protein GspJ [Geobacter sp. DSM 9736]SNB47415.1 general secretion pathway protein J [Geobacter sp. DSM 9736]